MTRKTKESKARIGTRLRGALAEAYDSRGDLQSILWLHYSPTAREDVVFPSQLEYLHFLQAEWDPRVASINYRPQKRVARVAGEILGTIVDAEITLRSGEIIWREVKYKADLEAGAANRANLQLLIQLQAARDENVRHEVVTEEELYRSPMALRNAHRTMAWLAGARHFVLTDAESQVLSLLRRLKAFEFGHVLKMGDPKLSAIFGASVLNLARQGRIQSDLDARPFTARTRFYLGDDDGN